jgi:hypothetical protein
MTIKRIVAVVIVFLLAGAGWWLLGVATAIRSETLSGRLGPQVAALWGAPLVQAAPQFKVQVPGSRQLRPVLPDSSQVKVRLTPDHRRKGLIWYPTYNCEFEAIYTLGSDAPIEQRVRLHFDFPARQATYDGFALQVDGQAVDAPVDTATGIDHIVALPAGQTRTVRVHYRTRGNATWRYRFDPAPGHVKNLRMDVLTGFRDVDYPPGCLSPMLAEDTATGMRLVWEAADLISRADIGVVIPEKLNPGPLSTRITFFAPVGLLFFFVLMAAINVVYRLPIHPMHYLFVAAGFFAFHLLLAYLVGLIHIHLALPLAALVAVALVTGYLRAALKGRFPWRIAVAGQLFFLVLFSYSFFVEGYTGLTIALGAVATLAVLMKVTAAVDWDDVFRQARRAKSSTAAPSAAPRREPAT